MGLTYSYTTCRTDLPFILPPDPDGIQSRGAIATTLRERSNMTHSYHNRVSLTCGAMIFLAALHATVHGDDTIEIRSHDDAMHSPAVQTIGVTKTNGVFQFDGKTSRMSFPYRDTPNDKTIWVRFKTSEPEGGDRFRIVLSNTTTGHLLWGFSINTGWNQIMARICDGKKQSVEVAYRPKHINAWHDVGLTYQASIGIVRFYVDGRFHDIAELKGYTPAPSDQNVWLGWDMSDSSSYLTGEIAKVRIFDRCLSDQEIARLSNQAAANDAFAPIDPKTLPGELDLRPKSFKSGKNVDWLRNNRARIVCGVDDAAAVDRFAKTGFDVVAPSGFTAVPDSYFNATFSTVVQVAKRCKELDKKAMPYYWFTPGFFTQRHYQKEPPVLQYKYVNRSGVPCYAPCPINAQYWDSYLRQGLVQTARLSKEYPIVAIAVDFELYETETSGSFGHCFCDACWGRFCRAMKIDGYAIPPVGRYLHLAQHKLQDRYVEWQSKEARKLGAWLAQSVHEVDPDLPLAYINYTRDWFPRSVVQGFAADGIPSMAFTEGLSYACGYTPKVDEMYRVLSRENTLFYPGLWISFWNPVPDLAVQAHQLGMHADGWWLAPGVFLTSPQYKDFHQWDGKREGGPHGPQEEYLKLFDEANQKLMESGSKRATP